MQHYEINKNTQINKNIHLTRMTKMIKQSSTASTNDFLQLKSCIVCFKRSRLYISKLLKMQNAFKYEITILRFTYTVATHVKSKKK